MTRCDFATDFDRNIIVWLGRHEVDLPRFGWAQKSDCDQFDLIAGVKIAILKAYIYPLVLPKHVPQEDIYPQSFYKVFDPVQYPILNMDCHIGVCSITNSVIDMSIVSAMQRTWTKSNTGKMIEDAAKSLSVTISMSGYMSTFKEFLMGRT